MLAGASLVLRYGCAIPRSYLDPGLGPCEEETIVVATLLTLTMTGEAYGRLTDRLRHVMQFSEGSRQAAEEALVLLEAAKEKGAGGGPHGSHPSDHLGQHAEALGERVGDVTVERQATRDVDAAVYLLAVHRLVEDHASGKTRFLAQAEAMAIMAALNHFAPTALSKALAVYEREDGPLRVVLEAIAARERA
jgi:hypothetical protein